ncbi:MAG: tripartite tricarboxylate transporter permease [Candidatus ainarchaeum sp.]|nr:tripartite tricarboxylate transporter permease [Candidatus ainarchaeum sp.]
MDFGPLGWIVSGCVLGIFTGLAPGIHVNTIASISTAIAFPDPLGLSLMIASLSIVHCFVDLVPGILFGAPEETNFLSAQPGHRLLIKGKGFLAVKLAATGALFSGIISLCFAFFFITMLRKGTVLFSKLVPFALVFVITAMVFSENSPKKKAFAITAILLSGILGIIALSEKSPVENPLFACITGFFGIATILESLKKKTILPKQETEEAKTGNKSVIEGSALGFIAGALVAVFPALGANQAAFILQKFFGKIKTKKFLVLIGGSSTANVIFGFAGLFAWGKTRNGSAAAVGGLVELSTQNLVLLMIACAIALGFGFLAAVWTAKFLVKKIEKINYSKINIAILFALCGLSVFLTNFFGIIALVSATGIGLFCAETKIKRTHCMAFLMIPALLFYLGF